MLGQIVDRIAAVGKAFAFFAHCRDGRITGDDASESCVFVGCHEKILLWLSALFL
jgi:hypothetical protein